MPDSPVSILHLVASLGAGGAEKQLYLLATNASSHVRHRVCAVCAEGAWAEPLRRHGVEVICLGASGAWYPSALLGLVRLLRRYRPDVVHCWLPSMNLLGSVALWLAGMSSTRVVASVRNVDDWKPRWRLWLERTASRRWDAVICNSQAGREQARSEGVAVGKLELVVNGIPEPPEMLRAGEARRRLDLPADTFVVACASRLVRQKRVDRVVEAARHLPAIQFVIAGSGPLLETLRQTAPANVRLPGALANAQLLFAAADLFVAVSEREGTSNSLLEALQAGCPALVTDAGDNLLIAGPAGLAVKPDDLAASIQALAADPAQLRRMRAAAPSRAALYSVAAMVHQTEAIYSKVAGSANAQPQRVLFLDYTNGIGMGGGQRSLLLLLTHLNRERYRPLLACPPDETWRSLAPSDVAVLDLPLPAAFRRLSRFSASWLASLTAGLATLGSIGRIRQLMVTERIDIVHANNFKMLLLAALATLGRRIPVLWHVRDILPERRLTRWTQRAGARLATRVITVSKAVANQFPAPTELVHNAVHLPDLDTAGTARLAYRSQHSIPGIAFVFGYVGRIDEGKGIDVLIRAFACIAARFPNAWLLIAGEGECRPALAGLARDLDVRRITWTGFETSPGRAFAALDCAVVAPVEPDSFPRAVIEAMSWSLPVIGSRSGGIAEAIVDGITGAVVPAGDAASLAAEMERLCREPELATERGRRGRQECERRFTVDQQMLRIENLYQEVLREAR